MGPYEKVGLGAGYGIKRVRYMNVFNVIKKRIADIQIDPITNLNNKTT